MFLLRPFLLREESGIFLSRDCSLSFAFSRPGFFETLHLYICIFNEREPCARPSRYIYFVSLLRKGECSRNCTEVLDRVPGTRLLKSWFIDDALLINTVQKWIVRYARHHCTAFQQRVHDSKYNSIDLSVVDSITSWNYPRVYVTIPAFESTIDDTRFENNEIVQVASGLRGANDSYRFRFEIDLIAVPYRFRSFEGIDLVARKWKLRVPWYEIQETRQLKRFKFLSVNWKFRSVNIHSTVDRECSFFFFFF